jgi:GNAT superfamily N-acetyltransferase
VTLLWRRDEPIGICVFVAPPKSLSLRNRYFGRSSRWDGLTMRTLSTQLVTLQRVVLHPTYRGAGIAAAFIRRSCELCPFPWIETLTQLGHIHPVFEQAGFTRVGVTADHEHSRVGHSKLFKQSRKGGRKLLTEETSNKSRYARPVYYVFDNRR